MAEQGFDRRSALAAGGTAGAALLAATPALALGAGGDAAAANVALARRHLIDLWQDGKFETVGEILHPDFVDHDPGPGQGQGVAGVVAFAKMLRVAFPDQRFEFIKLFAVGDLVVDHWVLRATHTGPLGAVAPTGRKVEFHGIDIVRIKDHRIIENWHVEEIMTMFVQLGLVQPPALG